MTLIEKCRNKILCEIFQKVKVKKEYKILVLDQRASRIISACCKMNEIINEYVAMVEVLERKRQRIPYLESIYIIDPIPQNIQIIMSDFEPHLPAYRCGNVFLLTACSEEILRNFGDWSGLKYLKTLKEVSIGFIPIESQVFSLEDPYISAVFYSLHAKLADSLPFEDIAEKIATLCETLNEYPYIRYQRESEVTLPLAEALQKKMDIHKEDEPQMGQGPAKSRSQIIILDRGFDGISPLLHELTFQAMIYDMFPIENNMYTFPDNENKVIPLSEKDDLYAELRHQHIATVTKIVTEKRKVFIEQNSFPTTAKKSAKSLSEMMRKMPQYQKQLKKFADYIQLITDCMDCYSTKLNKFCTLEQDMAMSTVFKGKKAKDLWKDLLPLLKDQTVPEIDKIRLLLIYVLSNKDDADKKLKEGLAAAKISEVNRSIFKRTDENSFNVLCSDIGRFQVKRKDRSATIKFETSRWTPLVKDIMEDAINLSLDKTYFPFLHDKAPPEEGIPLVVSRRFRAEGEGVIENRSRLIIFIVGGVMYSEIRCAYEVTEQLKDWEVIIGSDCLLTPKLYLKHFQDSVNREAGER